MGDECISALNRRQLCQRTTGFGGAFILGQLTIPLRALAQGTGRLQLPKEIGGIRIPDTDLARGAAALAHMASRPFLFNHCMRTYVFACMAAERMKWRHRDELVFIASALHDLGLVEQYESKEKPFEEAGADFAKAFVKRGGFSEETADLVSQGIKRHTSDGGQSTDHEVAMIMVGAGIDVFGRLRGRSIFDDQEFPKKDIDAIVREFRRENFNKAFRHLLTTHARGVPTHALSNFTKDFVCNPRCGPMADALENTLWPE